MFQIVFEGIVGANYHGDIALDDLTLSTGSCTDTGSCVKLVQQVDTRLTICIVEKGHLPKSGAKQSIVKIMKILWCQLT